MTSRKHTTGTDRIFEATQKLNLKDTDFIINVQGDEPLISPSDIKNLNKISKENNLSISTLAYEIKNKEDYKNENIVKVKTKKKISDLAAQKALNFYRKIHNNNQNIYHHFGIYSYRLNALKQFVKLQKTKNEITQKLEQLRVLDNNMKIDVLLANHYSVGIDTKKDLDECRKLLNK